MEHCFKPAHILLPRKDISLTRWACVACDQFTSQPAYWEKADALVGDAPSTLRLVLPEVYLGAKDESERIAAIQTRMKEYEQSVLTESVDGFVYLERTQMDGSIRAGLLGAVDLEAYSYTAGSRPVVRPSESTVVSRIPPRLAVRRGADLELPHVMMLVDDDACSLIEPIGAGKASLRALYDGDLMLGGGHITGWAVEDTEQIERVLSALDTLGSPETFAKKYPAAAGEPPLTMAVGDGNHSLATAKAYWEEIKATLPESEWADHPARFCLCEICNVHSPAIQIEPIHRVLFGVSTAAVLMHLASFAQQQQIELCSGTPGEQSFTLVTHLGDVQMGFNYPVQPLTVGSVESFIEYYLKEHPEASVDYIHGESACRELVERENGIAFLLPEFEKSDLFKGVVLGGVLPRKTFSMGHAEEKRYYLESRKITR